MLFHSGAYIMIYLYIYTVYTHKMEHQKKVYMIHMYSVSVERSIQLCTCQTWEVKAEIDEFRLSLGMQIETFSEVNVTQGGNDLLQISMMGLKRLMKQPMWTYLVKLSEFDYPVASLQSLEQHLWASQDLNFVGFDPCYKSTCSRHLGTACGGQISTDETGSKVKFVAMLLLSFFLVSLRHRRC